MLGIGRKLAVAAASLLMPAISVGGVPLMAPRRPTRRLRTSRKRVMIPDMLGRMTRNVRRGYVQPCAIAEERKPLYMHSHARRRIASEWSL